MTDFKKAILQGIPTELPAKKIETQKSVMLLNVKIFLQRKKKD